MSSCLGAGAGTHEVPVAPVAVPAAVSIGAIAHAERCLGAARCPVIACNRFILEELWDQELRSYGKLQMDSCFVTKWVKFTDNHSYQIKKLVSWTQWPPLHIAHAAGAVTFRRLRTELWSDCLAPPMMINDSFSIWQPAWGRSSPEFPPSIFSKYWSTLPSVKYIELSVKMFWSDYSRNFGENGENDGAETELSETLRASSSASHSDVLVRDAMEFATKATQCDRAGQYQTAIFYYAVCII